MKNRKLTFSEKTILKNALGRYAEDMQKSDADFARGEFDRIQTLLKMLSADLLESASEVYFQDRLRGGIMIGDLSEAEVAEINALYAAGEALHLSHSDAEVEALIEEKIPFDFKLIFDKDTARISIAGEGAPIGRRAQMSPDELIAYEAWIASADLDGSTIITLY